MKKILEHAVQMLENAHTQLKRGTGTAKSDLEKDGVIQRFEFTFEVLWKCLKLYLKYQGIVVNSPRESLRESFRTEIIESEMYFSSRLSGIEDRNKSSHIYERETAEKIFERITEKYVTHIEGVLKKPKEAL